VGGKNCNEGGGEAGNWGEVREKVFVSLIHIKIVGR
jgi:hypothetical protein